MAGTIGNVQSNMSYNTGSSSSGGSSSSSAVLPQWYLNAGNQAANYYTGQLGGLSQVGAYQGDRFAGLTPDQQAGIGQAGQYLEGSSPLYNQGAGLMGAGANMIQGSGDWQQSQMMQHMNPYTEGALSTMAGLANRNLTENVMPGINSTFTGAGQFGSTRNADFLNRAIRDNQEGIMNQGGVMLNNAYGQAADDYYRWNQQQMQAGQALGGLGQTMGAYGIQGLNTGMNLGQVNQQANQGGLDAGHAAWREGYQFPLELYNSLGTGMGNALSRLTPEQNQSSNNYSSNSQSSYNLGSSVTV